MLALSRQISGRISGAFPRSLSFFATLNLPGTGAHQSCIRMPYSTATGRQTHESVVSVRRALSHVGGNKVTVNVRLHQGFTYVVCQNYSSASGQEVEKRTDTQTSESAKKTQQSEDMPSRSRPPTNMERRIFVWTGKYKTVDEVPDQVSEAALNAAKNKFRIYVNLGMGALTLIAAIVMVIIGKSRVKKGESLSKINIERHPEAYSKLAESLNAPK